MKQLVEKIEQWANDRNLIKGSDVLSQSMKLLSECGELADNVGKGRDVKDDIGDVFVVASIMAKQSGFSIYNSFKNLNLMLIDQPKKILVLNTVNAAIIVSREPTPLNFYRLMSFLNALATDHGTTLIECVEVAYNDIKDRKGKMINNIFVKEGDNG